MLIFVNINSFRYEKYAEQTHYTECSFKLFCSRNEHNEHNEHNELDVHDVYFVHEANITSITSIKILTQFFYVYITMIVFLNKNFVLNSCNN